MAEAEAEAEASGAVAVRTQGQYEEKKGKVGKITKKKWYIIDPRASKFIPYWDGIGMLALLFTAIVTFVEVAFVENSGRADGLFIINRCVDCIFTTDMILQFFLIYPQQPKSVQDTVRWVHDHDKIVANYGKSWFPIDLISILVSGFDIVPLLLPVPEVIEGAAAEDPGDDLKVLRMIRILRLVKLVRLVRSSRIMKRFESRMAVNYGHLALFKCLVGLLIASHWYACLWGLMTSFESESFDQTWYAAFGYCQFDPPDGGLTEAYASANPGNSSAAALYAKQYSSERNWTCVGPTEKYIAALYWAIMTITSIGYGDIRAPDLNTWEQTWCLILMLLGGMIWGSVIATFCGVVANLDPAGTEFRTTMDNLNRFMALQGLPQDMKQSLREYFHQTKHLQLARANKVLIENMSPMLQGQVVWKVNEKWLRHVWFLAQAEDSFMVQLSLHLTAAVFAPAELCPSGYMYIIHRGIALYGGKVLTSGKVWGEDMILSSIHLRSKYAARCMTYVEVYMIGRDDLIDLATKHPATLKLIRRSAFRLGFRREMIRRAQVSIKSKEEAAGIKSKESAADKMLVSVSSRKVDDEQAKEEAQKRAEMDAAMVTGADGDAPAAGPAALPPLASPIKGAGGGGDSGEVISAVQQLLAVHGQQQQQAAAALETRLKKQNDDLLEKVAALSQKLDAMAPPS